MLTVGIDPGLTGACAVIEGGRKQDGRLIAVFDLPTMAIPNAGPGAMVKTKIDSRAFYSLLLKHCPASDAKPTVVIEAVGTVGPKMQSAVQTQGSLMRSLGALEAVIECLRWPVRYLAPQKWKRPYLLLDSESTSSERKTASLATARKLYPECQEFVLAKHHNRAEAALLAHYHARDLA